MEYLNLEQSSFMILSLFIYYKKRNCYSLLLITYSFLSSTFSFLKLNFLLFHIKIKLIIQLFHIQLIQQSYYSSILNTSLCFLKKFNINLNILDSEHLQKVKDDLMKPKSQDDLFKKNFKNFKGGGKIVFFKKN